MDCRDIFNTSFVQSALLHARLMIDMGIWSGIERHKFDSWCHQFEGETDRIVLALVLKSLVYRSKEQVRALLFQAFDKGIPQKLFELTGDENVFEKMKLLQNHSGLPKSILIVPVIRDCESPTKSGPLVARLFKKVININDKIMKWPWNLGEIKDVETIIFVDDFVGTGNQFLKFCEHHMQGDIFESNINFIYAPITANKEGLDNIAKSNPRIHLCPIEIVSKEDNFFNAIEKEYSLNQGQSKELEEMYMSFLEKVDLHKIGQNKGRMVKGYGELALTYVYEHGTPNGSLPILWANNNKFTSLFSR
ncbi:hypothetical protein QO198_17220 [Pseudoalteromonas distincta]|uniref:phosphoribosyltransferase-like protein n=1 Tax=Pseudoalteromonas distincta TaxID=77608 RepID=UPI00352D8F23